MKHTIVNRTKSKKHKCFNEVAILFEFYFISFVFSHKYIYMYCVVKQFKDKK